MLTISDLIRLRYHTMSLFSAFCINSFITVLRWIFWAEGKLGIIIRFREFLFFYLYLIYVLFFYTSVYVHIVSVKISKERLNFTEILGNLDALWLTRCTQSQIANWRQNDVSLLLGTMHIWCRIEWIIFLKIMS